MSEVVEPQPPEEPAIAEEVAEPQPPPPEGAGGARAPRDRFRTFVAITIVASSILGALVGWRASVVAGSAVGLDQRATQQLLQLQRLQGAAQGKVDEDLRLLGLFQEHVLNWRLLQKDSAAATDPVVADELAVQALSELNHARSMLRYFQAALPDFSDPAGVVSYDREFALENASDQEIRELRPGALFVEGRAEHGRAVQMLAIVILLIVSLFFLTLAQFARRSIRGVFAGAGFGVVLLGAVLWILVEAAN